MPVSLHDVRRLADFMSHLSERYWSAGWMTDLEVRLWDALQNNGKIFEGLSLEPHEHRELAALSKACGGWIYFEGSDEASAEVLAREPGGRGEMFVTFEEWLPMFQRWERGEKLVG